MKLSLEPFVVAPQDITAESRVLARWYDSHPAVRRLWGLKSAQLLRVVVALEPTLDSDDVFPVWFVNIAAWTGELRVRTGCSVQIELYRDTPFDAVEIDAGSVIIADLFWRDATL